MTTISSVGESLQRAALHTSQGDVSTSATEPNVFERLLSHANDDQKMSNEAIQSLVAGETDDVQQVVMQVVKSEMSFQMFMEIRNRLVDSYNELMRMQF